MNSRQIEQFVAIAEHGSLGKAARSLGISQPALTKTLHQLEEELKVTLLTRSSFGVQLTASGESLFAHGKRASAEIGRAREEIEALRGARKGRVSVGTIPLGARVLLPRAVGRLTQTRREITVSVSEKHNYELVAAFRKGDFEFILALLDEEEIGDRFLVKELFRDELVAVVRPEHPAFASDESPDLRVLALYSWIYPKIGTGHRRRLDACFRAADLAQPKVAVEGGGSGAFIAGLLSQTDYVAALSAEIVSVDRNMSSLKTVALGSELAVRRIGIAHRGRDSLSSAARLLLTEIERQRR